MTSAVNDTSAVPDGTVARLTAHYGPSICDWLAPAVRGIEQAATAWGVTLVGYHDAGWASIIAHGALDGGQRVVIKATPERDRYLRETACLRHWRGRHVPRLLAAEDTRQLLLMEMIGPNPGGSARPGDHEQRVARRLVELHRATASALPDVPHVRRKLQTQTLPGLRRSDTLRSRIGAQVVRGIISVGEQLAERVHEPTLLHGDLYVENIAFDAAGEPRFIDPRGLIGPIEFDWAFWCVFYVGEGFLRRVSVVDELRLADTDRVLRWSAVLAASRIRYQLDAGIDHGLPALAEVLSTPAVHNVIARP